MTKVLLLMGSPRGKKSSSNGISNYLEPLFQEKGLETEILFVRKHIGSKEKLSKMLDTIESADIIILTAPLYDDCQPFIVSKMMESLIIQQRKIKGKLFIPIINCGFAKSHHITAVSISIYRRFVFEAEMKWGGSLAIGAGEGLQGRKGKQLDELGSMANNTRNTLQRMVETLAEGNDFQDEIVEIMPPIFHSRLLGWFFKRMNNRGWKKEAKKHGEAVDARPYSQ